jgi:molecular chaperone IbpA
MTNGQLSRFDLAPFHRSTVGFDRLFNDLDRVFSNSTSTQTYPPYNIIQINENEYEIAIAVAGFSMEDLDITMDHNELTIIGTRPAETEDTVFLHKGIGARGFQRVFTVADHVEVESARLELGLLKIQLVRNVPEELQPKKIAITTSK